MDASWPVGNPSTTYWPTGASSRITGSSPIRKKGRNVRVAFMVAAPSFTFASDQGLFGLCEGRFGRVLGFSGAGSGALRCLEVPVFVARDKGAKSSDPVRTTPASPRLGRGAQSACTTGPLPGSSCARKASSNTWRLLPARLGYYPWCAPPGCIGSPPGRAGR